MWSIKPFHQMPDLISYYSEALFAAMMVSETRKRSLHHG